MRAPRGSPSGASTSPGTASTRIERSEHRLERTAGGPCGPAATADRDHSLVQRLQAEGPLQNGLVERRRYPRAEAQLGAQQVEGLTQVSRVEEHRAVDLGMTLVFPEAAPEPSRHDEGDGCLREEPLPRGRLLHERTSRSLVERGHRLEHVLAAEIVVHARFE